MFVEVPAIVGVPLVGTRFLHEGRSISDTEAIAYFAGEPEEGWIELTDLEYLAYWQAGKVAVDKNVIVADGVDTATITVEVAPGIEAITFYHNDTGEVLSTAPVDPETNTTTYQIKATSPGVIRIRAGEPTRTRLNEVEVRAI